MYQVVVKIIKKRGVMLFVEAVLFTKSSGKTACMH
jgi:hypothetical protein